nr:hypothetical protein [Tanacetum cinerariifolium]
MAKGKGLCWEVMEGFEGSSGSGGERAETWGGWLVKRGGKTGWSNGNFKRGVLFVAGEGGECSGRRGIMLELGWNGGEWWGNVLAGNSVLSEQWVWLNAGE